MSPSRDTTRLRRRLVAVTIAWLAIGLLGLVYGFIPYPGPIIGGCAVATVIYLVLAAR